MYVTVEEADEYVATHLVSTNPLRIAWEALSESDKSALLLMSFVAIEGLTLRGRKTSSEQATAFPRWPETEVSQRVKDAQIINAVFVADPTNQEDAAFYNRLKSFGINSYRIGNLSETLLDYWSVQGAAGTSAGIYAQEALRLLQPYLQGGFNIA